FPDEEGTERLPGRPSQRRCARVEDPSPMKRGLKVHSQYELVRPGGGCRPFPAEEGTERRHMWSEYAGRHSVEDPSPMKRGLKVGEGQGNAQRGRDC